MASLIENLISVLEGEAAEYDRLLELSTRKTPVIVAGNLEELQRITDDEQEVVNRINRLDNERSDVMNRDVKTLKLATLVELLSQRPQESRRLAEVHDRLKSVTGSMQRVNEQNKELIAHSLEMIDFDLNLLQAMKAAPETANYDRGAHNAGGLMGSDRGSFDAKS